MPVVGMHHAITTTRDFVSDRVALVTFNPEFFEWATVTDGRWDCRRLTARRMGCRYVFVARVDGSAVYVERGRLVITRTRVVVRALEQPPLRIRPPVSP